MRGYVLAGIAAVALLCANGASEAQMRRGPEFFPTSRCVNQHGQQLKFYDDLIKDQDCRL